jgi:hypothetical protein
VNCTGGGNPCQAIIPILVDNSTCVNVDFNGYVQATCELEASLNGRIPFSVIFTPVQPCNKWDITCGSADIPSYNILTVGSGYIVGSDPIISVVGGGGSFAAAHGIVGDGGIKTWTVTNGGAGYLAGGSGTINNVPAFTLTGVGSGALFNVTVVLGVITSLVLSASNIAPGVSYAALDTFEFNNVPFGGVGAGGVITVNTINTGEIQYIVVDNVGSAYSSVPLTTFEASPGVTATVSANLGNCPQINAVVNCAGNTPVLPAQTVGYVYKMCKDVAPVPPTGWIVAENQCCYECVTAIFTNNGPNSVDVYYIECFSGAFDLLFVTVAPSTSSAPLCVTNNSWSFDPAIGGASVVVGTTPGC